MIGRPAGRRRHNALEPQRPQIQLVDEHVDHPDRVVLGHVVVQRLRQQECLPAVFTLDETPHNRPCRQPGEFYQKWAFLQASVESGLSGNDAS